MCNNWIDEALYHSFGYEMVHITLEFNRLLKTCTQSYT